MILGYFELLWGIVAHHIKPLGVPGKAKKDLAHASLPGRPVAQNLELLCLNNALLRGFVAHYFGLLGFPAKLHTKLPKSLPKTQLLTPEP